MKMLILICTLIFVTNAQAGYDDVKAYFSSIDTDKTDFSFDVSVIPFSEKIEIANEAISKDAADVLANGLDVTNFELVARDSYGKTAVEVSEDVVSLLGVQENSEAFFCERVVEDVYAVDAKEECVMKLKTLFKLAVENSDANSNYYTLKVNGNYWGDYSQVILYFANESRKEVLKIEMYYFHEI